MHAAVPLQHALELTQQRACGLQNIDINAQRKKVVRL